jgi:hypothetical protein
VREQWEAAWILVRPSAALVAKVQRRCEPRTHPQPWFGEQVGAADAQYPPSELLGSAGRMTAVSCSDARRLTMHDGTIPHRPGLSVSDMSYVAPAPRTTCLSAP